MARASAPKKNLRQNATKTSHPRKNTRATNKASGSHHAKRQSATIGSSRKDRQGSPSKTDRKAPRMVSSGSGETMESETRKRAELRKIAHPPEPAPRLLRDTKSTAAALVALEKGIRLLYQKEVKKARTEFKQLLENHPGESEILARARSYLQICDREDAVSKKPAATADQLYTLGVMHHNRGDYDGAISYFRQSIERNPRSDYMYYSLAASLTMKGDSAEALKTLQKAIELNEDNRVYAKNDGDFAALHVQKEFVDLVGLTVIPSELPPS